MNDAMAPVRDGAGPECECKNFGGLGSYESRKSASNHHFGKSHHASKGDNKHDTGS